MESKWAEYFYEHLAAGRQLQSTYLTEYCEKICKDINNILLEIMWNLQNISETNEKISHFIVLVYILNHQYY